jgi:ParB family chromosome partitioning protein
MAKRQALGKGLGALLDGAPSFPSPSPLDRPTTSEPPIIGKMAGSIASLTIAQVEANPNQPRTDFEPQALEELAQSIRELGIIQPITVHRVRAEKYQIISGERRFRAAQLAGMNAIPAYIREADDQTLLEMALVENIQREDLHAIEVAISFQRLIEECNLTHDALGLRLGKDRSTITNYMRLLQLPGEMQVAVRNKSISMGHARALVSVSESTWQRTIFLRIQTEGLSVRQTEELAKAGRKTTTSKASPRTLSFDQQKVQADLRLRFGKNVMLKSHPDGRGKIEIPYDSAQDLDELLRSLNL